MERRNLWVEFASRPSVIQGGLYAANSLTQRQLLNMLNVAFRPRGGFDVSRRGSTTPLTVMNDLVEPGYYILSSTVPGQDVTPSRDHTFRRDVRQRDGRCVITGLVNDAAGLDHWCGFEAAHIFPLALSMIFTSVVTDDRGINSPNNGILLRSDIHQLWDGYDLAVNPDDDYRVYSFQVNTRRYHGSTLNNICRRPGDTHRVSDVLLRWHFEQAVLSNVRGEAEPVFEFDFPPSTDMMGEIREGPLAAERIEAELCGRLYSYYQGEAA